MKVNFAEEIKKDEQEFDLGGDYYKFEEGDNRIRICSPMVGLESVYKDKKTGEESITVKFVTLVLDRRTQSVKTAFIPFTVKKAIAKYQQEPDYAFDEVPMPYDVTVSVEGSGLSRKYTNILPARTNTPLTAEELKMVQEAGDVYEIVKKIREKQDGSAPAQPVPQQRLTPQAQQLHNEALDSLSKTEPPPFR